jgi:hypothetical protein
METSESSKTKKSRKSKLKIKVMLIVFFDCHGIVHHEFVPEGQSVNAAFYLHQDNAPSHTALIVREFLVHNSITVMDHPPYSPDLAPCDFFLFRKCKLVLCGRGKWQRLQPNRQRCSKA